MGQLYSLSRKLRKCILDNAKIVELKLDKIVEFDEYIVLPDYGEKIIIRFSLVEDKNKGLNELDDIENSIRNILGHNYWGNILGNTYKKFGFNINKMTNSLEIIDLNVSDDVIEYNETNYSQYIKKDKELLRKILNLSNEQKIWEIQVLDEEDTDALILIIDESIEGKSAYEKLFERDLLIGRQSIKVICFKNHKSFRGIIKAYLIAEKSNVSLAHMIMKYQKMY